MAKATYKQIITKNGKKFQDGAVIRRRSFCKMFRLKNVVHEGTFDEVQRSNLLLVGAQAEINRILRHSGLVMKSRGYYSEFYIGTLQQTSEKVLSHQAKSEAHKKCSDVLEKAVIQRLQAGTWGTFSATAGPPMSAVVARTATSATYTRKLNRLKRHKGL